MTHDYNRAPTPAEEMEGKQLVADGWTQLSRKYRIVARCRPDMTAKNALRWAKLEYAKKVDPHHDPTLTEFEAEILERMTEEDAWYAFLHYTTYDFASQWRRELSPGVFRAFREAGGDTSIQDKFKRKIRRETKINEAERKVLAYLLAKIDDSESYKIHSASFSRFYVDDNGMLFRVTVAQVNPDVDPKTLDVAFLNEEEKQVLIDFAEESDKIHGLTSWGPRFNEITALAKKVRDRARR